MSGDILSKQRDQMLAAVKWEREVQLAQLETLVAILEATKGGPALASVKAKFETLRKQLHDL